jgi:hypothetical protein
MSHTIVGGTPVVSSCGFLGNRDINGRAPSPAPAFAAMGKEGNDRPGTSNGLNASGAPSTSRYPNEKSQMRPHAPGKPKQSTGSAALTARPPTRTGNFGNSQGLGKEATSEPSNVNVNYVGHGGAFASRPPSQNGMRPSKPSAGMYVGIVICEMHALINTWMAVSRCIIIISIFIRSSSSSIDMENKNLRKPQCPTAQLERFAQAFATS